MALLEGTLAVRDLPEAWHARYTADLGIAPPDDRDGVLQDVHWYCGIIGGAFQGYTLGNILSAQFYEAALGATRRSRRRSSRASSGRCYGWLRENIYRHGSKFTAAGAGRARHRRPADHRAVYPLSARQVRRAVYAVTSAYRSVREKPTMTDNISTDAEFFDAIPSALEELPDRRPSPSAPTGWAW